jgi:hypothetical protein
MSRPLEAPEVEEVEGTETAAAPPWMTILHNCDCHTFEQVVQQLMKAIGCSEDRGWELAWEVHNTGKAWWSGQAGVRACGQCAHFDRPHRDRRAVVARSPFAEIASPICEVIPPFRERLVPHSTSSLSQI